MRMNGLIPLILTLSFTFVSQASNASTVTLDPSSDGSLYTCSDCNPNLVTGSLLVSGYIQGVTIFPTASVSGQITQASLEVNPYGLPLSGPVVDVYGFTSTTGTASGADANTGTFLGAWTLPANLGYGQPAYFDVTSFVTSADSPYVGFNLRTPTGDTDVFSSVQENYGLPEQLTVSSVPLPPSLFLLCSGLIPFLVRRQQKLRA